MTDQSLTVTCDLAAFKFLVHTPASPDEPTVSVAMPLGVCLPFDKHNFAAVLCGVQATVTRRQSSRASKSRAMASLKTALQSN